VLDEAAVLDDLLITHPPWLENLVPFSMHGGCPATSFS